eukprot:3093125-Prymnesium_polylepis.1
MSVTDESVSHLHQPCFHSCCGEPGRYESCHGKHGSLTEWCQSGFCGDGVCCQLGVNIGGPCDGGIGCDGHKCCTAPPQPKPPPRPPPPAPPPPIPLPPPQPPRPPPPPPTPRAPAVLRCVSSCGRDRVDNCGKGEYLRWDSNRGLLSTFGRLT